MTESADQLLAFKLLLKSRTSSFRLTDPESSLFRPSPPPPTSVMSVFGATAVESVDLLDVQLAQTFPLTNVHSFIGLDGWTSVFAKVRPLRPKRGCIFKLNLRGCSERAWTHVP